MSKFSGFPGAAPAFPGGPSLNPSSFHGSIYLIGARGTGKTTVGRLLAQELGREFVDLDEYLSQKTGHPIADIVKTAGWEEFRRIEKLCLREASQEGGIISTGGGIVLAPENREFLRKSGFVVWLNVPPSTIVNRLAREPAPGQRPALTGLSQEAEIWKTMREREDLYKSCCHCAVDGDRDATAVCGLIKNALASE